MNNLPEPRFRLTYRDGAYYVSKPNIGNTDVYTADQMRAALAPLADIELLLRDVLTAPGMNSITAPEYAVRVAKWLGSNTQSPHNSLNNS